MPKMKILIVEDKSDWRHAIREMYQKILKHIDPEIIAVSSGPEAIETMRRSKYDLLSLDINLGETHPKDENNKPDKTIAYANGVDVLRKAAQLECVNGIVIITGIDHDDTLPWVFKDENEIFEMLIGLQTIVNRLYPDHNLYLKKVNSRSIKENINIFLKYAKVETLTKIAETRPGIPPPYRLKFYNVDYVNPEMRIYSRSGTSTPVSNIKDSRFLFSLAIAKKQFNKLSIPTEIIGDRTTFQILFPEEDIKKILVNQMHKRVRMEIGNIRNRLKGLRVSDKHLFKRKHGKGYFLHPDVKIEGIGTEVSITRKRRWENDSGVEGMADPDGLKPFNKICSDEENEY